ncbi:UNVERIFIED_CONTAM: glyctk [Trichonephila clavipes]
MLVKTSMKFLFYHFSQFLRISNKFVTISSNNMCQDARIIFEAAYKSVQPLNLISEQIKVNGDILEIQGKRFTISKNVHIIGFGKAVLGMAATLETKLKENLVSGILSVPEGIQSALQTKLQNFLEAKSCIQIYEGASKNIPDDNSLLTASKITDLVSTLNESDLLIVLISGGGSALLPAPKPPLTLKDKQKVIQLLASRGAEIEELNAVRKRLSMLKGGKLAILAKPAEVISLVLSDIIGDPLGMIASGPTVQNTDNPSLAMSIIEKYKLHNQLPESVIQILTNTSVENQNESFSHVSNFIIGNNKTALNAAAKIAEDLDYDSFILTNKLTGIASNTGRNLILLITAALQNKFEFFNDIYEQLDLHSHLKETLFNYLNNFQNQNKKLCLLLGGETTVTVYGSGVGGRNQELALAAALELHKNKPDNNITLLSAGTDGIDGPTCAAGAIATISEIEEAKSKGLDPSAFLNNNDSYTFFSQLNEQWLVKTGHTGTNVMDVIIILIG